MLQQDEKGQLWLVEVSNLQGRGEPKVQRIQVLPNELEQLAKEQAHDLNT